MFFTTQNLSSINFFRIQNLLSRNVLKGLSFYSQRCVCNMTEVLSQTLDPLAIVTSPMKTPSKQSMAKCDFYFTCISKSEQYAYYSCYTVSNYYNIFISIKYAKVASQLKDTLQVLLYSQQFSPYDWDQVDDLTYIIFPFQFSIVDSELSSSLQIMPLAVEFLTDVSWLQLVLLAC